jgi:two-component system sensor histidine kinase PhoQ
MQSLQARLLVAATLVLAGFLGAAAVALHQAFRESAEQGMRERLQAHVYALLAAADEDAQGRMLLPEAPPDPRFSNVHSGLYALVRNDTGSFLWRSPSLAGHDWAFLHLQPIGEHAFAQYRGDGRELSVINFGIAWEDYLGQEQRYTFAVATDTEPLLKEIQGFRNTLGWWLGGLALMLLAAQGWILRWGLRPLRNVAEDLRLIEEGESDRLNGVYPLELRGLTGNLNTLIASTRANQQRYRNSLGDLAHSMKTPLAILRNAADEVAADSAFGATVREQVARMDNIVQHQLRRAAASGSSTLGRAVDVAAVTARLARSLAKVYRDKPMAVELALAADSRFFGDEADLMEVLGNVLENAFKYGKSRVRVNSETLCSEATARPGLRVRIGDDGSGIAPEQVSTVMQRGRRMDQSQSGQGLGLSVAAEIVAVYGGRIAITLSALGGAEIDIQFPGV